jgi:hypothetical protein
MASGQWWIGRRPQQLIEAANPTDLESRFPYQGALIGGAQESCTALEAVVFAAAREVLALDDVGAPWNSP